MLRGPGVFHLIERNTVDVKFAWSVNRINAAGCPEPRPHDDRLGGRSAAKIVDPSEQFPIGYACGSEKDVVAADEIGSAQHA